MSKKLGEDHINEQFLYHGTRHDKVSSICVQNFDWRLSGCEHGAVYGQGSYFARDAHFSHGYSTLSDRGDRFMFVASVLVGRFTKVICFRFYYTFTQTHPPAGYPCYPPPSPRHGFSHSQMSPGKTLLVSIAYTLYNLASVCH